MGLKKQQQYSTRRNITIVSAVFLFFNDAALYHMKMFTDILSSSFKKPQTIYMYMYIHMYMCIYIFLINVFAFSFTCC